MLAISTNIPHLRLVCAPGAHLKCTAHARLDTLTERATQARVCHVQTSHLSEELSCEKRCEGNAHASAEAINDHCIISTSSTHTTLRTTTAAVMIH